MATPQDLKQAAREAVKKNIVDLKNAISATFEGIILSCEQEKLISSDLKTDLFDSSTNKAIRCSNLITHIQNLVGARPAHLDTFLCILNDKDLLASEVANSIAKSYGYNLPKYERIRARVGGATSVDDQYHHKLTTTSSQTSQSTTGNKMSSRSIFQSHFAHLTQAINPMLHDVSAGLFAEGLIPQATVNEMQTAGLTDDYKSSKLMTVLMMQLNASFNPDNYLVNICKVFISQNHQQLTDIANSILHQLGHLVQS